METSKIDRLLLDTHKTCIIVCDMAFEKSKGTYTTVKLEIEGKPEMVDQVMTLLSLKFSLVINFHGGLGYATFTKQKILKEPVDIDIIHFRVCYIEICEDNGIVLDGAIRHVTLSPKTLTSSKSWIRRLKVDRDYDSGDDSVDEPD